MLAVVAAAAAATTTHGPGVLTTSFQFATEEELVNETGSRYRRFRPEKMTHWANVTVRDVRVHSVQHTFALHGFEYIKLSQSVRDALTAVDRDGLDGQGITFDANRGHVKGLGTVHHSLDAVKEGLGSGQEGTSNGATLARSLVGGSAYALTDTFHYNLYCGGFVIRASLPGGTNATGLNGPAVGVHIDQDCQGEPLLTKLAGGWLPVLFRWFSFLKLTSLWLPLRRPTVRPVTVMDRRTFDRDRHQVHYTDWKNQRFFAVFDDGQEWWYDGGMQFGDAVTWGLCDLPHASFSLPGEEPLAELRADITHLSPLLDDPSAGPPPICSASPSAAAGRAAAAATEQSHRVLADVAAACLAAREAACSGLGGGDRVAARALVSKALYQTTRKSVEARCLSIVVPRWAAYTVGVVASFIVAYVIAVVVYNSGKPKCRGKPIPQRLPIRLLNALPLPLARLDADRIIAEARRAEGGLNDFGDPPLRTALTMLCRSVEDEARLSNLGRIAARTDRLVATLRVRLRAQELFRAHPEILSRPVTSPVIIAGLPRSGTTMLHRLLSADPRFRLLRTWEAGNPAPFRGAPTGQADPRIAFAKRAERGIKYLAPAFMAAHAFEAEGVEEEVMLLDIGSFLSCCQEATFRCPTFAAWRQHADNKPGYECMKRMLQLLDWQEHKERWLLKTPHHLWYLQHLFDVFPDAKVIITHRDPRNVVPSMCKLIKASRSVMSEYYDDIELGREWSRNVAGQCLAAARYREQHPDASILDIGYKTLMADTMGEVKRIYDFIGWELPADVEALLESNRKSRPQHAHGKHDYGLADFGLSEEDLATDFREYAEAYGKYL
eukprot:TRINITY_DN10674_c0_g1_i1.p1 TRINITY_DN10674_c0_g1~~TRINITY_DN10674_c0_g1_i1.p1  ORF type:complete len:857 (+),score=188.45 TRINITY_DN10674_c0_g1_i1:66-2573(+)